MAETHDVRSGFREGGCQKRFKTQSFKKVLGLNVSGQGKLEFESDLSKILIKQNNIYDFAKTLLSHWAPVQMVSKGLYN